MRRYFASNHSRWALLTLAAVVSSSTQASGPTSVLYAVEHDRWDVDGYPGYPSGLDLIQGSNVSSSTANALGLNETAIAVSGDVRTLNLYAGGSGSLFDLGGNILDHHAFTTPPSFGFPNATQLLDSTSDGSYNYGVDNYTGTVFRMDRDWTNPIAMFSIGSMGYTGITMNPGDGSFWLSDMSGIEHYSHQGNFLGSFQKAFSRGLGLAFDPADGTLWTQGSDYFMLAQYSQSGSLLQNTFFDIESYDQSGLVGMEFNLQQPAPEPATMAVMALGSALLLKRRNRRRFV